MKGGLEKGANKARMNNDHGIKIRKLTLNDVDALAAIDNLISGKNRPSYWLKKLKIYTVDPEACVAAEADGKMVGYMIGHVKGGEFGAVDENAWVEIMGVDPEYQGRHLGQLLAQTLFDYFRRIGVKNVYTMVNWRDGSTLGFFDSLGFNRGELIHLETKL